MFFRMPRFLRRYIRQRTHPMKEHKAFDMRKRLAIIYAIIAWHGAGFVFWQLAKGNKSWPQTAGISDPKDDLSRPALSWAKALGVPHVEVIRMDMHSISESESFNVEIAKASPNFKNSPGQAPKVPSAFIEDS